MNQTSDEAPDRTRVPAFLVFWAFLKLGFTSFGGPIAHLGYFRREFVERRRWLSDAAYTELVALCQFLPGPASSQTGFVIGLRKAGLAGGLAAFTGFSLPSAALMFAAAWGVAYLDVGWLPALVHGLKLVAVSIVAHAVIAMARAQLRSIVGAMAALLALIACLWGGPYAGPASIAAAALIGLFLPSRTDSAANRPAPGKPLASSFVLLATFAALLVALPLLRQLTATPLVVTADGFYRTGALVFGGGHVILPLIEAETAGRLSHEDFLAGYGAAQALPGPLSAFAAYAGALASPSAPDLASGLVALLAIFLPGFLLVAAADPVWSSLRAHRRAGGMVALASAAVVGVLAAAWWSPVAVTAIRSPVDLVIAAAGLLALLRPRTPVLAVVIAVAALGAVRFAVA
jgi:chromate transporter